VTFRTTLKDISVDSSGQDSPERLIYLDNNASTPVDRRVLDAMLPYLTHEFGNAASSSHAFGWRAAQAVESARASIAEAIEARSGREIIFTSGATESINLAIKGLRAPGRRPHVITSRTEHKAVLESCRSLESSGAAVTYLPVDATGLIDLGQLAAAITDETALVSIMLANNEIGTVQDIEAIGEICRPRKVLFHTDATQGVGKVPFSVRRMKVDMASFSAHKLYGPKGAGALYVSRETVHGSQLSAQIEGGGHEGGLRSGTLNVPGIVGLATALEICCSEKRAEGRRLGGLRDELYGALAGSLDNVQRNGHPARCLPGLLNVSFASLDAGSLLRAMKNFALSSGSACTSAGIAPSHVLKAIGLSDEMAQASVRFGIGRFNTQSEIKSAADCCAVEARRLLSVTPVALPGPSAAPGVLSAP
jgi:cysteine desulfurase